MSTEAGDVQLQFAQPIVFLQLFIGRNFAGVVYNAMALTPSKSSPTHFNLGDNFFDIYRLWGKFVHTTDSKRGLAVSPNVLNR